MKSSTGGWKEIAAFLTTFILVGSPLYAQEQGSSAWADPFDGWATAKMVFYLVVVGALAYGGVYLLRRLGGGRHTKASQGIAEVLGQLPLSSKHTLFLIKVGGRVILAGATAESINPLAVIDDPEEVGELVSLARMNKAREGCLRRTLGILKKKNLASLRKMKVFSARTDKLATLPAGPQPADSGEARQA